MTPSPTPPAPLEHADMGMTVPPPRRFAPVSLRAFLLGLLLIPLLVYWVEYTEIVANGPDLAAMALPTAVLFMLLVLVAVNRVIRRLVPARALTQAELLTIFSMNAVAVGISGIGQMQFLSPTLVGWLYYATPSNGWANRFYRFVPSWAVPDKSVAADYYAGRSSLFTPAHLAGWAPVVAVWTGFLLMMMACLYCITVLIRRQWVERERLVFPIVQIPLAITQDGGSGPIWRSTLLWAGVTLPVLLEVAAAIHFTWLPAMPYLPLKPEPALQIDQYVVQRPWNAIGVTPLSFYPFAIGLAYLLPLDVSFSCWFFYWLAKLETIGATAFGFRDAGAGAALAHIPYTDEQAAGAWVGLALFSLLLARPHLLAAWRKAFRGGTGADDSDEPLSYRAAFLGLFVSSAFLVAFGVALGLSLGLSIVFWVLFLLFALTMTRIRAEAGIAWGVGSQSAWPGAHQNLVNIGGTQNFTAPALTGLTFLRWFDSDLRCLAQPPQLEAMKLAGEAGPPPLHPRQLTWALGAAALVGTLAAWACCLGIYYHYGAAGAVVNSWRTSLGASPFASLVGWMNTPLPSDPARLSGAVLGLGAVSLLSVLRTRFVWWPLHPIGYAIGSTDMMAWLWCPTLIGWLAKSLILRYGGAKLFRQALPFFLGLILGDYAISGILALICAVTGQPGYRTFPN